MIRPSSGSVSGFSVCVCLWWEVPSLCSRHAPLEIQPRSRCPVWVCHLVSCVAYSAARPAHPRLRPNWPFCRRKRPMRLSRNPKNKVRNCTRLKKLRNGIANLIKSNQIIEYYCYNLFMAIGVPRNNAHMKKLIFCSWGRATVFG